MVVNGKVTLRNASETQIDNRQSYTPITSSNLDYAVKSIGDGYYVKNDEYATKTTAGIVKASEGGGIGVSSTGNLFTIPATNEDIDAKTNTFKPIVSSNLDYAVKSVGDGYYVKNDEYISSTSAGIAKLESGLGIWANTNHALHIAKASEEEIDAKSNNYKPIVPSNLDYAVKSVGDEYYVKTTDIATKSDLGIVKANGSGGISVNSAGNISIVKATDTEIDEKTNDYKAIVPSNLDYAVKSVGDGYYVKTTDYATGSVAGIMRPANGLRISGTTGAVVISKASDAQIDAKTDNYYPIVPANLDYAVKSVGNGYYMLEERFVTLTQDEYTTIVETGAVTTADGKTYTFNENTYYDIVEE